ncbi:group XIIB secretory phospholipase A2-like protein isoform X2 [Cynoglossus semilaevis]|uniref:Phospholipase A2, group XIIB n=1 Tax=Cynoglossus semilaevis TaxID=244447 RepID=A0A3P8VWZ9_CYNSE|nr:group XIIB secretory phospholipase A2-like protein isoform X2 [Cynoglossus semilaevis]
MLLRILVPLLLLCVSTGMCASLVSLQAQDKEVEKEDSAEKLDVAPAVEGSEAAAEEPLSNTLSGNNLLGKLLGVDNPEADKNTDGPAAVDAAPQTQELPSSTEDGNDIKALKPKQSLVEPSADKKNDTWSINSIRDSFQTVHTYFDSLVELVGGRDGVCQYRCRYGEVPQPRSGYVRPEPNGCSSSLVGFQLDLGIPAMTQCCNQLDSCYDTCGTSKYDCDSEFRSCVLGICSDLKKSLGFGSQVQVQACDSVADVLYNTVWTLGCRPYMNSQRSACVCDGEERDEL